MLPDRFLHTWHVSERHEIRIDRPPETIFPLIRTLNLRKSRIINILFTLRGLPRSMDTLEGFIKTGFIELAQTPNEEIVLGFVLGLRGIRNISPSDFSAFDFSHHVKGVWNFRLVRQGETTRVSTETRVLCMGKAAKALFLSYWFVISAFSGLTRKEMLKLLRKEAQKQGS